jgi:hypothetical protein
MFDTQENQISQTYVTWTALIKQYELWKIVTAGVIKKHIYLEN